MVTLAERALRLDLANYHRLRFDTRRPTELIDRRVVEMKPIGTAHRVVVTRLQQQLDALNRAGRLLVGQPVQLGSSDEPQPDLAILHGPQPLRPLGPSDIALVIEVADSTLVRDRRDKLPRYLAGGLPVWIVNVHDHAAPRRGSRSTPAPRWRPSNQDGAVRAIASSRQQAAGSRQQAAGSRQRAAGSGQRGTVTAARCPLPAT
jgi:Uma2 family endonuclease